LEKSTLKDILVDIKEKDYKVPESINISDLSLDMINYIGDLDSELRDSLIYNVLVNWTLKDSLTDNFR